MWDAEAVQALIAALDEETDVRHAAQARLAAGGDAVVDALIAALAVENGRIAWAAAEVLGQLTPARAFPPLVAALYSKNLLLAGMALNALLKYPEPDVLPYLAEALPRVHIMTQQNIVVALRQLGDRRAAPLLIAQLPGVSSPTIRCAMIQTLGWLGDRAAIPAIRACEDDSNHHVREWAAVALAELSAGGA